MTKKLDPSPRRKPCDLCGQTQFELIATRDRRGGNLRTVVCRRCGLVSHEQVPSEQELQTYYLRAYRWEYHGEFTPSAHRVVREWRRGKRLVRRLRPYLRPEDRLLEVGCGIGCTVKNFELAGWDATGIEPGEGFRQFAQQALKAQVTDGVLADGVLADVPAGAGLDLVLLVHVLEHLPEPTAALTRIRAALAQHGRLYIEVPNAGAPHAAPGKAFHYAHIYNFTVPTMAMLAGKTGYEVVRWLSRPHDKNLCLLLQRSRHPQRGLRPDGYRVSVSAMHDYSPARYYLRRRYLADRIRTAVSHPSDRVMAQARLNRILNACRRRAPADNGLAAIDDSHRRRSA